MLTQSRKLAPIRTGAFLWGSCEGGTVRHPRPLVSHVVVLGLPLYRDPGCDRRRGAHPQGMSIGPASLPPPADARRLRPPPGSVFTSSYFSRRCPAIS